MQSASASDYKGMPTGSQVTLGYNSARINEATGNFQAAATVYKGLLESFPGKSPFHPPLALSQAENDWCVLHRCLRCLSVCLNLSWLRGCD